MFEAPTSLCEDICDYFSRICHEEFGDLAEYYMNIVDFSKYGVTMINCSNTGEYLDPLGHCCSDLKIEIRKCTYSNHYDLFYCPPVIYYLACTNVSDSGDLVQDPDCMISEPQTTDMTNNVGAAAGISTVLLFVIAITIVVSLITMWRHWKKKQANSNPTLANRYHYYSCLTI